MKFAVCESMHITTTSTELMLSLGNLDDIIQIQSIDVSPDPPQPGEDLTVTVSAYVTEIIEVVKAAIVATPL
jgi:hypothetical protein